MSEEQLQEQTTTPEVTNQTIQDAEPAEQITQTNEPENTNEAESSKEGQTTEILTPTEKALKDTKAALTKLQQERAAELKTKSEKEKADAETKLESETKQVGEKEKQVKQEHKAKLEQLKVNKANLLHQYSINPHDPTFQGMNLAQLTYQLDSIHDNLKEQADAEYQQTLQQVKQAQETVYNQTIKSNHAKADEILGEKLSKPEIKLFMEKAKAKYPNMVDIAENIIPILEEVLNLRESNVSKTNQINSALDQQSGKQKGINGASTQVKNGSGIQSILEDPKRLEALLKF